MEVGTGVIGTGGGLGGGGGVCIGEVRCQVHLSGLLVAALVW